MKNSLLVLLLSIALNCFSQDTWISIPCEKYYILMPGKPDTSTVEKYLAGYGRYSVHRKVFVDSIYSYGLSVTEYPLSFGIDSQDSTQFIDSGFDGAISSQVKVLKGTYPSEIKKISLNGFPGREYVIEVKSTNTLITSRMYLVNNKLYSLMVGTTKENSDNTYIKKFLDSFLLKP